MNILNNSPHGLATCCRVWGLAGDLQALNLKQNKKVVANPEGKHQSAEIRAHNNKQDVGVLTGCSWFRIGPSGGMLQAP